jgi:heme exporter protein A
MITGAHQPPAPFPPVALGIDGLACRRGDHQVFTGVSAALDPGSALLVTGPNGAGKTTLLAAIAGSLRPAAGTIGWTGLPDDTPAGELIQHLGHLGAVKPSLSLAENLGFWRDLYGGTGDLAAALASAGLDGLGAYPAGILSAGQARRLALARLIVAPRPVWLLDEPTAGLDADGAQWVAVLIADHLAAGGIAVVATHQPIAIAGPAPVATLALEPRRAA